MPKDYIVNIPLEESLSDGVDLAGLTCICHIMIGSHPMTIKQVTYFTYVPPIAMTVPQLH